MLKSRLDSRLESELKSRLKRVLESRLEGVLERLESVLEILQDADFLSFVPIVSWQSKSVLLHGLNFFAIAEGQAKAVFFSRSWHAFGHRRVGYRFVVF